MPKVFSIVRQSRKGIGVGNELSNKEIELLETLLRLRCEAKPLSEEGQEIHATARSFAADYLDRSWGCSWRNIAGSGDSVAYSGGIIEELSERLQRELRDLLYLVLEGEADFEQASRAGKLTTLLTRFYPSVPVSRATEPRVVGIELLEYLNAQ